MVIPFRTSALPEDRSRPPGYRPHALDLERANRLWWLSKKTYSMKNPLARAAWRMAGLNVPLMLDFDRKQFTEELINLAEGIGVGTE